MEQTQPSVFPLYVHHHRLSNIVWQWKPPQVFCKQDKQEPRPTLMPLSLCEVVLSKQNQEVTKAFTSWGIF